MTTGERDPELIRELGARIASTSKIAGLDQTKLAEVAGVSRSFVQMLWRGGRLDGKDWGPKPDNLMAVIGALNAELHRRGETDAVIDQREALRLAGVNERDADRHLPKRGRPTVSATHLAELVGKLTHRQREAIVEVVESMVYPTTADEIAPDAEVWHIEHKERPRKPQPPGSVEFFEHEEKPRSHRRAPKPAD